MLPHSLCHRRVAALITLVFVALGAPKAQAGWLFGKKREAPVARAIAVEPSATDDATMPIRRATLVDETDSGAKAPVAAPVQTQEVLSYATYRSEAWELDRRLGMKLDQLQDSGIRQAFGLTEKSSPEQQTLIGTFPDLRRNLMADFGNHQEGSNFWSIERLLPFSKTPTPGLVADIAEIGKLLEAKDRVKFLGLLFKIDFEALRFQGAPGTIPTFRKPDGLDALLATLKADTLSLERSYNPVLRDAGMLARTQIYVNELRVANFTLATGTHGCAEKIHAVGQIERPPETLEDPALIQCFNNTRALVSRMAPAEKAPPGSPEVNATLLRAVNELPTVVGGTLVMAPAR